MRIPVGDFGFAAPRVAPRIGVPQEAFGDARGIIRAGQALGDVADLMYEREAVRDATAVVNSAKQKLHEFRLASAQDTGAAEGTGPPRYETMVQEFDAFAKQIGAEAQKATTNRKARDAIGRTLSNVIETAREQIMTKAQERRNSAYKAKTLSDLDWYTRGAGLSEDERRKGIDQTLGGAVAAGSIDPDDAFKLQRGALEEIEYGKWFSKVQGATSLPEATEIRAAIPYQTIGLSPERRTAILAQANARVIELEKRGEKAVEEQREDVQKMFQDAQSKGLLSVDMVQRWRSLLSADDYARAMHDAQTAGSRQAEGQDDPDTSRRLLDAINRAHRDPARLAKLRDQVSDAARGYDPVTKSFGTPRLSRSTARTLINDIDEYTNRVRTDARQTQDTQAGEKERKRKERGEVEGLVRQQFKRYIDSRATDSERRQAESALTSSVESLLRDGYDDPMAWYDKWKANNEAVVKSRPPLPAFVPAPNGKPDFGAARRQLTEDFKARKPGVQTQQQYDARFRMLQQLEREYAQ